MSPMQQFNILVEKVKKYQEDIIKEYSIDCSPGYAAKEKMRDKEIYDLYTQLEERCARFNKKRRVLEHKPPVSEDKYQEVFERRINKKYDEEITKDAKDYLKTYVDTVVDEINKTSNKFEIKTTYDGEGIPKFKIESKLHRQDFNADNFEKMLDEAGQSFQFDPKSMLSLADQMSDFIDDAAKNAVNNFLYERERFCATWSEQIYNDMTRAKAEKITMHYKAKNGLPVEKNGFVITADDIKDYESGKVQKNKVKVKAIPKVKSNYEPGSYYIFDNNKSKNVFEDKAKYDTLLNELLNKTPVPTLAVFLKTDTYSIVQWAEEVDKKEGSHSKKEIDAKNEVVRQIEEANKHISYIFEHEEDENGSEAVLKSEFAKGGSNNNDFLDVTFYLGNEDEKEYERSIKRVNKLFADFKKYYKTRDGEYKFRDTVMLTVKHTTISNPNLSKNYNGISDNIDTELAWDNLRVDFTETTANNIQMILYDMNAKTLRAERDIKTKTSQLKTEKDPLRIEQLKKEIIEREVYLKTAEEELALILTGDYFKTKDKYKRSHHKGKTLPVEERVDQSLLPSIADDKEARDLFEKLERTLSVEEIEKVVLKMKEKSTPEYERQEKRKMLIKNVDMYKTGKYIYKYNPETKKNEYTKVLSNSEIDAYLNNFYQQELLKQSFTSQEQRERWESQIEYKMERMREDFVKDRVTAETIGKGVKSSIDYYELMMKYGQDDIDEIAKEALKIYNAVLAKTRRIKSQAKIKKLPDIDLGRVVKKVVDNYEKEIKRLNSVSRSRVVSNLKSSNEGRGVKNIFVSDEQQFGLTKEDKEKIQSLKRNIDNTQIVKIATKEIFENRARQIKAQYKKAGISMYQQGNVSWREKCNINSKAILIRQSGIKPYKIDVSAYTLTKRDMKRYLLDSKGYYGLIRAAFFFQILVTNTPVDEEYDYDEIRTEERPGKAKFIETTEYGKDIRDAEDVAYDMLKNRTKFTRVIHRHHVPDKERVRDYWEFTYKGVKFTPKDEMFADWMFMTPGDPVQVAAIFNIIRDRTSESNIKNINFHYKNTNPRWEQLEYGGYPNKESGPWHGQSQFGYEHGVKNHFTWQAPNGYLRLIEAQWNSMVESGEEAKVLSLALSKEGFNAKTVGDEMIKELRKYDTSLGTRDYDYKNWILIEEGDAV